MAPKSSFVILLVFISLLVENSTQTLDWGFLEPDQTDDMSNPVVLQTALRNAHAQRLADLEALEKDMDTQIRSIQKRKYDITAQKRQHVACLVHVLSCYKRRR